MSKNKKKKDIKTKMVSTETTPKENTEILSNNDDTENITSIEEVTENSSNNIGEKLEDEINKENLEEVTQSSPSPSTTNNDDEIASTNLLKNDIKLETSSNNLEKTEITVLSKTERIIYENLFYKYVGIQTINSDGSTSYDRYIIAEIEGVTHRRKLPWEFRINEKGHIIYEKQNKDDIELILISDSLVFPTFITENYITRETKIELSILKNNGWLQLVFPSKVIYNQATQLSNYGIKVTGSNSKYFTQYIIEFENNNQIPTMFTADRTGWTDEVYNKFIPFTDKVVIDSSLKNLVESYSSKGTFEEWVKEIQPLRSNRNFRFCLASAFSAPLLPILKERPYMVYLLAPSGSGKTACLYAVSSSFGNPDKLVKSLDGTKLGIELILTQNNNLPVILNERQIVESQNFLEQIIFLISNGIGRIRGGKNETANMRTFSNVVLGSGEEPVLRTTTISGVGSRCIELSGPIFENEQQAASMYKTFKEYYGTGGRKFISELIKNYSNTNYNALKLKLNHIKGRFQEETNSDVLAYITAVSIVTLTDILLGKWLFETENEEESIEMGIEVLNSLNKSKDIDVTEKAYEYVKSYIVANHDRFSNFTSVIYTLAPEDDIFGGYSPIGVKDKGVYYMFLHEFENLMIKNKFPYHKVAKEFAQRGYIQPTLNEDGTIKSPTVQKKVHNRNIRCYAFYIPEVEKYPNSGENRVLPASIKITQLQDLRREGHIIDR